jgi:hypothetical protein
VVANQALFYAVELFFLHRNARFSLATYLSEALLPLGASLIMAAGVVLLTGAIGDLRLVLQLAAEIALGAAIYGVILLIFGRQRLKEPIAMAKALKR